jgi:hypothetical protein
MFARMPLSILAVPLAFYLPMCTPHVQPTAKPWGVHIGELWQKPMDLREGDLFYLTSPSLSF